MKLFLLYFVIINYVKSERILAILPFPGKSHYFVYEPVLLELAKRGHNVTVVCQFARHNSDNYNNIDVSVRQSAEVLVNLTQFEIIDLTVGEFVDEVNYYLRLYEGIFNHTRVQSLLQSNETFDLVISEIFLSEMFTSLAHKFDAPLVGIISSVLLPWATDRFAVPDNPSYIRTYLDQGAGPMTFYERLVNTFVYLTAKGIYRYFIIPNDDRVVRQYLGDAVPSVNHIIKRSSLVLVNSHFSINGARPLPPQVKEIGGVHLKPAKPLPQELDTFINESEHGVIYFSLGTIANASSMSESMRSAFCRSFVKLKQRILWKWESDFMPGKPDNVMIVKWMPQTDILANPNVKLFIGHGGLLGVMEAIHNAVPMIGIPIFADQYRNIANLVQAGSAIMLDVKQINENVLTAALDAVLNDPGYKMNARKFSTLFEDRPETPLETAVYWIEYVLRHQGAHHLRTVAVDLPWYQYLLLDVVLFVLTIIILVLYTIRFILRKIFLKRKVKIQ